MQDRHPAERGLLARDSPWAEVREVQCETWGRVIQVSVADGWRVELLCDRGLDIGLAWYRGVPIAWRSPLAHDPGPGAPWEARFLGGLLSTCGTENIGPAHSGLPMHGSHHHTPAADASAEVHWTAGRAWVRASARVESTDLDGRRVIVHRQVVVRDDTIVVEDHIRNAGHRAQNVALLYHVNLGYPLVAPGTIIQPGAPASFVAREGSPREVEPWTMPPLGADSDAAVFEVRSTKGPPLSNVRVRGRSGLVLGVGWSSDTLPRLNEWMWPRRGVNVLAIEPSNAPLFGSDRDAPHAGSPVLEPGGSLRTQVEITCRSGDPQPMSDMS